jgi:hypothetical protein
MRSKSGLNARPVAIETGIATRRRLGGESRRPLADGQQVIVPRRGPGGAPAAVASGRRLHRWAIDAGFEVLSADAHHPHYLTGEHKGLWGWTFHEAGANLVAEGAMTEARYNELSDGMRMADDDPSTLVPHARMHQLVARKPR